MSGFMIGSLPLAATWGGWGSRERERVDRCDDLIG